MTEAERLKDVIGHAAVVDTDSDLVYIGTLAAVDEHFYELADADVHDTRTTTTPRDLYIINVAKFGVKQNRNRVRVRRVRVVSVSRLDEVTVY